MRELKDLTILVVDDEPDLGELVAFEFELAGAKVLSALNGKEAFKLAQENQIDVLVSDIRMPGGDGVELLENLRGVNPKTPALVFMTGFADITLEDAYSKGAVAMFGKPFDRNELIAAVEKSVQTLDDMWDKTYSDASGFREVQLRGADLQDIEGRGSARLGRGGLFVAAEGQKLPAVADIVRFSLVFEKSPEKTIEGEGVVRWIRRYEEQNCPKGFGIEIQAVVGDSRQEVLGLFESLSTAAYIPKA